MVVRGSWMFLLTCSTVVAVADAESAGKVGDDSFSTTLMTELLLPDEEGLLAGESVYADDDGEFEQSVLSSLSDAMTVDRDQQQQGETTELRTPDEAGPSDGDEGGDADEEEVFRAEAPLPLRAAKPGSGNSVIGAGDVVSKHSSNRKKNKHGSASAIKEEKAKRRSDVDDRNPEDTNAQQRQQQLLFLHPSASSLMLPKNPAGSGNRMGVMPRRPGFRPVGVGHHPGMMKRPNLMPKFHPLMPNKDALFRRRQGGGVPMLRNRQHPGLLGGVNPDLVRNRGLPGVLGNRRTWDLDGPFLSGPPRGRQPSQDGNPGKSKSSVVESILEGKLPAGVTRKDILRLMAQEFAKSAEENERQQPSTSLPPTVNNTSSSKRRRPDPDEETEQAVKKRTGPLNDGKRNESTLVSAAFDERIPWVSIAGEDTRFKRKIVGQAAIDGSIQHAYTIMDAQRSLIQERLCDLHVLASVHNITLPLIDADLLPDYSFILHDQVISKGLRLASMLSDPPSILNDGVLGR